MEEDEFNLYEDCTIKKEISTPRAEKTNHFKLDQVKSRNNSRVKEC